MDIKPRPGLTRQKARREQAVARVAARYRESVGLFDEHRSRPSSGTP